MIRIAGGYLKGQYLKSDIKELRPTGELVRLSIFNILERKVERANVLDLFAGSGALGIEALSRGADKVVFVDKNYQVISIIKQNLVKTNLLSRSVVKRINLPQELSKICLYAPFEVIFLDPPYDKKLVEQTLVSIADLELLAEKGTIVVEHSTRETLPSHIFNLIMVKSYSYGDTILTVYNKEN